MPAPIRLHPIGSRAWWRVNAVSLHDTWNVALLGALNLAHMGWWAGLNISPHFVESLYMADMVYFLTDFVWLLALPECVAARVWHTLVAHHSSIITCGFFAFGKPVLMRQALRCWVVELASWNHIAQRKWDSPWLERINKPLFVVTRLIGWPVTYFAYTRDRSSLPAAEILAQAPPQLHIPLSIAQLLLYGLMLHWGYNLLVRKPDPPPVHSEPPPPSDMDTNGSTSRGHPSGGAGGAGAGQGHVQRAPAEQGKTLTPLEKASAASRSLYSATVLGPSKKGD